MEPQCNGWNEKWAASMARLMKGAPEGATMREIAAAMAVSIPTARERVRAMIEAGVCECAGRMPRISEVTGEKCSPVTYRMKKR